MKIETADIRRPRAGMNKPPIPISKARWLASRGRSIPTAMVSWMTRHGFDVPVPVVVDSHRRMLETAESSLALQELRIRIAKLRTKR